MASPAPTRSQALTRRAAVAGAAALTTGASAGWEADLRRVRDGDGDPRHELAGLAGASRLRGDHGVRQAAFGRAHIDPDRPMSADSAARVASISKLVTAIGVMQLVEAGRIGLGDDASDLLGFRMRHPAFPGVRITLRQLLSHTSGVRNGVTYPVPLGRRLSEAFTPEGALFEGGGWWSPAGEPPGWFHYADANFACCAQIVERVTGERFDRHMRSHVLAPLGLDAGFNWSGVSQAARDRAATLYRKGTDEDRFAPDGPWRPQLDQAPPPAPAIMVAGSAQPQDEALKAYRPGENGFVFAPQGGLRASARDLLAIARMLAGGGRLGGRRILRPETVEAMRTPVWRADPQEPQGQAYGGILAYGLGTCVLTGRRGRDGDALFPGCEGWFGHLGEAYGLLSGLWADPGTGSAMAYVITGMSSANGANPGVRSAYTWQEERIAADLAARAPIRRERLERVGPLALAPARPR